MGKKTSSITSVACVPKTKCCESTSKCGRCPLRMLKEGTLPVEYAVKKRRLVHAASMVPVAKAELPKKSGKTTSKKTKTKKADRKSRRLPAAA